MKNIAILGPKNTYSDLCYKKYQEMTGYNLKPHYYNSVRETIKHSIDLAIIPLENTLDGYVQQHMDLIFNSNMKIDAEINMPIIFDYVYKKNAKNLYVQYVTKNQCLKFVELYKAYNIIITDSNVESYNLYLNDPYGAAIIPTHLVTTSNKVIRNVADEPSNFTRFLVLEHKELSLNHYNDNQSYKVSLVITPHHDKPGLLYNILKAFADEHINLISIMSRPTKKQLGTYHFYIEFMSDKTTYNNVVVILKNLTADFDINVLGMYQTLQ